MKNRKCCRQCQGMISIGLFNPRLGDTPRSPEAKQGRRQARYAGTMRHHRRLQLGPVAAHQTVQPPRLHAASRRLRPGTVSAAAPTRTAPP